MCCLLVCLQCVECHQVLFVCMACFTIHAYCHIIEIRLLIYLVTKRTLSDKSLIFTQPTEQHSIQWVNSTYWCSRGCSESFILCKNIFKTLCLHNRKSLGADFLRECSPPITCHISHVTCPILSCVICCILFFWSQLVEDLLSLRPTLFFCWFCF